MDGCLYQEVNNDATGHLGLVHLSDDPGPLLKHTFANQRMPLSISMEADIVAIEQSNDGNLLINNRTVVTCTKYCAVLIKK